MSEHDPFAPHDSVEAPDADTVNDAVPEGTVKSILEWVGEDTERAQRALEAEEAEEKPRASLVTPLKDLLKDA